MRRKLQCPRCNSGKIRSSQKRSLQDKVRFVALLRPFRCCKCDYRFYANVLLRYAKVSSREKSKAKA